MKTLPLHVDADNVAAPHTVWDEPSGLFQMLRAEAMRDLGLLSDAELAKAEHRLKHFKTVVIMNPFTGEKRRVRV